MVVPVRVRVRQPLPTGSQRCDPINSMGSKVPGKAFLAIGSSANFLVNRNFPLDFNALRQAARGDCPKTFCHKGWRRIALACRKGNDSSRSRDPLPVLDLVEARALAGPPRLDVEAGAVGAGDVAVAEDAGAGEQRRQRRKGARVLGTP